MKGYNQQAIQNELAVTPAQVITMSEDTEITIELIENLISDHIGEVARCKALYGMYKTESEILLRPTKYEGKPNNKLPFPYPSYIVDMLTGMFVGNPVNYVVDESYKNEWNTIQQIFDINDEQDENMELAKLNGIMGRSYEIIYSDVDGNILFNELNSENVIMVYDQNITPKRLFAIHYTGQDDDLIVNVFTRDRRYTYKGTPLMLDKEEIHSLGQVQILEVVNNNERLGDFERVMPLIDAYNKAMSDTANDLEEFTDSLLVLTGMANTDDKDIGQIREDGIILLRDGTTQNASWLTKVMNTEALENYLTRLDDDIHRFTKVPNLSDEKFAGNSSGVALAYKLLALQQAISSKERKFKRFLQDRIELILSYARLLNKPVGDLEYFDIDIVFNPNIPVDEKANVEMVTILSKLVSQSTALSKLWFMEDVNAELKSMEEEDDIRLAAIEKQLTDMDEEVVIDE